jgi:hypothetical protein
LCNNLPCAPELLQAPLCLQVNAAGRALSRILGEMLAALLAGVPPEDMTAIAKTMVERAKAGDVGAARLWGSAGLRRWPEEAEVRQREAITDFMG